MKKNNKELFFRLPREIAEQVIREAMSIAKEIKTDELDYNISYVRKDTDKTAEQVLNMGLHNEKSLRYFIIRYLYESGIILSVNENEILYFLWIVMEADKAYDLAIKYKLQMIYEN